MPNDTKRIHILSHAEIEELYARPDFNAHEQRLYFSLTPSERNTLAEFSKTKTRIFFILQLGYFKAKQQFFNFTLDDVATQRTVFSNGIDTGRPLQRTLLE